MKCGVQGCPGVHEPKMIVHTVPYRGETVVTNNMPAQVCSVCGGVLLSSETVRQIEVLLRATPPSARVALLCE